MSTSSHVEVAFQARFAEELPELCVPWKAQELEGPQLLVLNDALAVDLGFDPSALRSPDGLLLMAGNHVPEGAAPVAQAYAGHQFGHYSPRLGDGRALLLGEITDSHGRLRDLHLKGSGPTTFARAGDGQAVVGPMLREYVLSEAMHALGIPTTRSLAVVGTGKTVLRETRVPGAVLARVASSHLRVGTFQYARATGDVDLLRRLADHAIARHYPDAAQAEHPYQALLRGVIDAQASLVARWMLVGFVHGVMNTDNMTISGETIDYGPCAFMDAYDPGAVYSSIDHAARYAYGNQPAVAGWNLARLAEALLPLLHDDQDQAVAIATQALDHYSREYRTHWLAGAKAKIGLGDDVVDHIASGVVQDLLDVLEKHEVDYTAVFRSLGAAASGAPEQARSLFSDPVAFDGWMERWIPLRPDAELMNKVNPIYIPRNHLVEEALAAATAGDVDPFQRLLAAVTRPYDEREGLERYAAAAPEEFGTYRTFCGT
ncbi:YdiU family protein [Demequina sp. TTPB684]|uniref:protein adenylyltransferase SelO n=1 Tax=unclassified Demequina TaxID=2620311 RepID=UPI001CF230B0|nr:MULTISPECIES: YdiU family protein [unclassified Demequina]MCB2412208.1 YdiU family protein [Demequina sp. TTPB684]UPU87318.1 YdiU family protein [Demequina sp. TMPB413]